EERIVRLQAEVEKAPAPMRPAMEAILAHWYWAYYQQNRWRFLQRTETAAAPGPDIETWDLKRILAEIDKHFTAAVADEEKLKAAPIADYNDLLEPGSVPDRYRPTLFDFLANDALQFYQAGEIAATRSEDEFEIDADGPVFDEAGTFAKWQPPAADPSV